MKRMIERGEGLGSLLFCEAALIQNSKTADAAGKHFLVRDGVYLCGFVASGERDPHFLFEASKRKQPFTVKRKDAVPNLTVLGQVSPQEGCTIRKATKPPPAVQWGCGLGKRHSVVNRSFQRWARTKFAEIYRIQLHDALTTISGVLEKFDLLLFPRVSFHSAPPWHWRQSSGNEAKRTSLSTPARDFTHSAAAGFFRLPCPAHPAEG